MINAYILGQVTPEKETSVIEKLKTINNVEEAHVVFGKFDIVMKLKAETKESLNSTILDQIRKLPDIKNTQTLLVTV